MLFGDKRNIDILIGFLKSILNLSDDDYSEITIDDPHLKRETIDDKLGIVDVKLTTKTGKIIHIEIQVAQETSLPKRITYYNAKMLVNQLKSGEDYYKLKKVITIAIANFEIITDNSEYHHIFELREKSTEIRLTDIVEINTLELQKIPKESDKTAKYDWLQFLKSESEEDLDMIATKNPAIKKAVVELKRLSQDEEAQILYEARQKAIMDENSRIYGTKLEIVHNGIKMGLTDEQIGQLTGLPIIDIEKERNQQDEK
jgi:predicted transposase/invertase (TIGR01784 family)